MSKFKVGDRVRFIKHEPTVPDRLVGCIGVISIDDGSEIPRVHFTGDYNFWIHDYALEPSTFSKRDLKSGYLVEYRNGELRLVAETGDGGFVLLSGECEIYNSSRGYNDDLRYGCAELPNDIMRVYGLPKRAENGSVLSTSGRELIWQREEKPAAKKMTVADVCKALGYDVEIVKDGATDA